MAALGFERFKRSGGKVDEASSPQPSPVHSVPSLATSPQPLKILQDVQDGIEALKASFKEDHAPIDDNNQTLHRFCAKLEYLLQADMKDKKTITGRKKEYWDYFCECLSSLKGINDGIKYVKTVGDCKTALGKGRAFLRFCLMHHRLADSIQQCVANGKSTSLWYGTKSIWLQGEKSSLLISALYDLSALEFDLAPRGYDLDNAWPSFARKNLNAQHSWALTERSRTSSVCSLNSVEPQEMLSPGKADVAEFEHLTQELAISETIRSDIGDRMEALEQQKSIFQQTVGETRGELSMLESKYRELQSEHKELQSFHRELEKKHDKLGMEAEMREKEKKSQQSVRETKLQEQKAEMDGLCSKLSQLAEDLQISQENLEITSAEKSTFQNEIKQLQEQMKHSELDNEAKAAEFDKKIDTLLSENTELMTNITTMKEEARERSHSFGETEHELKESASLIVNMERKISSLSQAFVWLQGLKSNSEFHEIPDLEASFAVTLKDISHFVQNLLEKVHIATSDCDKFIQEKNSFHDKMLAFQQEANICREKMVTMETFIARLQENEKNLQNKVVEVEDALKHENEKYTHLNEDVLERERQLTEAKVTSQNTESEKSRLLIEITSGQKELEIVREDVKKQQNELQRTNECYNLATKSHSDLVEKLNTQERQIIEKDQKILDFVEGEKIHVEEKTNLLREKDLLTNNLHETEKENVKLEEQINNQTKVYQEVKSDLHEVNGEKHQLVVNIQHEREKVSALEICCVELKGRITEHVNKMKYLNSEMESKQKNMNDTVATLTDENNNLTTKVNSLQNQVYQYEREVTNFKASESSLQNTISMLQENESSVLCKAECVEKELNKNALNIVTLEKDFAVKVNENENLKVERDTLRIDLKNLQDQLYEKESVARVLQEKCDRVQDEVERTKEFYAATAKTEADLSDRFAILENNLREKDDKISCLTESEKCLTVEISKVNRDKSDLQAGIEKVQKELQCVKVAFDEDQRKLNNTVLSLNNINIEKETLLKIVQELNKKDVENTLIIKQLKEELEESYLDKNNMELTMKDACAKEVSTAKQNRQFELKSYELEQKQIETNKLIDQMKADFCVVAEEKEQLECTVMQLENSSKTNQLYTEQLNTECEIVIAERNEWRSKLLEVEQKFKDEAEVKNKMKSEYEVLSQDKYELEEKVETFEKEIHQRKLDIDALNSIVDDINSEKSEIAEQLESMESKNSEKDQLIEQQNNSIQSLEHNQKSNEQHISHFQDAIKEYEASVVRLQGELEVSVNEYKTLQSNIMVLQESEHAKDEIIENINEDMRDLTLEKDKLLANIENFKEKDSTSAKTIKQQNEENHSLKSEMRTLHEKLNGSYSEMISLRARFDDFQNENSCLVQEYDLIQQSFNDLKVTEEVVRSELSEMEYERDCLKTKCDQMNDLLKQSESRTLELKNELDTVFSQNEKMTSDFTQIQCKYSDLEQENNTLNLNLNTVLAEKEKHEVSIQYLENQIVVNEDEAEHLRCEIDSAKNNTADIRKTVSVLESQLVEKNTQISELQYNISTLDETKDNIVDELNHFRDLDQSNTKTINEMSLEIENYIQTEQRLVETEISLKENRDELTNIIQEKQKLQDLFESKQKEYDNILEELQRDKEQLLCNISAEKKETETLRNSAICDGDNIVQLKAELEKSNNEMCLLEKKLTGENMKLNTEINSLMHVKDSLTDDMKTFQQNLDTITARDNVNCSTIEKLQYELMTIVESKRTLEGKLLSSEEKCKSIKHELLECEQQKEQFEIETSKTVENLKSTKDKLIIDLETALSDIKEQLTHALFELESANCQKNTIEKQRNELEKCKADLEFRISDMSEMLKQETESLEAVRVQYEESVKMFGDCQADKEKLQYSFDMSIKEIEVLKDKHEEDVFNCHSVADSLRTDLAKAKEEICSVNEFLCSKDEEISMLKLESDSISKETEELKLIVSEKDKIISQNEEKVSELLECNSALKENLDGFECMIQEKDGELIQLSGEYGKVKNAYSSYINETETREEEQVKQQESLSAEYEDLKTEYEKVDNDKKEMEEAFEREKALHEENIERNMEIEENLTEMKRQLEGKDNDLKIMEEAKEVELESLRQEITSLEFQLSSEQLHNEEKQKSSADEAEFSEMKEKIMEQEAIIEQLQGEMQQLRIISVQHREQEILIQELKSDLETKDEENESLSEQLNKLQEQLDVEMTSSQKVQSSLDDEKQRTEESLVEKSAQLEQLTADNKELKKKLVKLLREKDTLWQKSDRLTFQQKLQASEKWLDDSLVTHCLGCNSEFSFTLRKHHCRLCGRIFCHNCSSKWVFTAHSSKKSRACMSCYIRYNSASEEESIPGHDSDIDDKSVDIPKLRALGTPGTPGTPSASLDVSRASSSYSDGEEPMQTNGKSPIPAASPRYDLPMPQSQPVDIGGNETDEDKLKDGVSLGDDKNEAEERFHVVSVEEIQRSLTMSGDTEIPAPLDPNMTCSMFLSLDELSRGEINSKGEVWIKPGKLFAIPVIIGNANTVFGWEFTSYPKDVVFSVNYRSSQSVAMEDGQVLVPPCKCDSHKQATRGELTGKQIGIYTLIFDNTYSRLTSKKINYSLFSSDTQPT